VTKKWFFTAALKGSLFEENADVVIDDVASSRNILRNVDVFFVLESDVKALKRSALPSHIMILTEVLGPEEIEQRLLLFPGRDFTSRLGHDIVNLFMPLRDYQYLSEETVVERVDRGDRLGKQLNIVGHLMQDDLEQGPDFSLMEFIFNFKVLAEQSGASVVIDDEFQDEPGFEMKAEKNMLVLMEELVLNWKYHSSGDERVIVDRREKRMTFVNRTEYDFGFENIKAILRRPFLKYGNNNGNGIGLFILSLCSIRGGFTWDLELKDSFFYLHLYF